MNVVLAIALMLVGFILVSSGLAIVRLSRGRLGFYTAAALVSAGVILAAAGPPNPLTPNLSAFR